MDQRQAELRADLRDRWGPAADRFLSDLRALRARAGLDQGRLAARAHYPRDVIAAAESVLPKLPVLAAYVRGCGGSGEDVVEWEDRWRSVTGTPASPLRSARVAGDSDAAWAGARLSTASPPSPSSSDGRDPAVILAALDRFAERLAQPDRAAGPGPLPGAAVGVAAGDPAGPEHLEPLQRVPREESRDPGGQRGGTSGRTLALIAVGVVICVLLILLAF